MPCWATTYRKLIVEPGTNEVGWLSAEYQPGATTFAIRYASLTNGVPGSFRTLWQGAGEPGALDAVTDGRTVQLLTSERPPTGGTWQALFRRVAVTGPTLTFDGRLVSDQLVPPIDSRRQALAFAAAGQWFTAYVRDGEAKGQPFGAKPSRVCGRFVYGAP